MTCYFRCSNNCADWCCGGATLVTIDEFRKCFDVLPVTIGFRKYFAIDREHETFLAEVGTRFGNSYIIGDFIAGNRYRKRCLVLDSDNLCSLHKVSKKPFQCHIVPFCAIYPENKQDHIFDGQKNVKFAGCNGYKNGQETGHIVWENGRFLDSSYGKAFHSFQSGMLKQKKIMEKVLESLVRQPCFKQFMKGSGILETNIPGDMLFNVLEAAGLPVEEYELFIESQKKLCQNELAGTAKKNPILADYLDSLNKMQS